MFFHLLGITWKQTNGLLCIIWKILKKFDLKFSCKNEKKIGLLQHVSCQWGLIWQCLQSEVPTETKHIFIQPFNFLSKAPYHYPKADSLALWYQEISYSNDDQDTVWQTEFWAQELILIKL